MKKLLHYSFSALLALFCSQAIAENTSTQSEPPAVAQPTQTVNVNLVNLNTATAAEIQDKLVGIGAKKAQAIVEYREKHGKFISIEQLTEVNGIGKATLDKNRERLVVE